jgi:putative chitinase
MILRNGSKGPEVKRIQEKLGIKPTGTFGPKTESAVKAWQKINGLKDDGIVGPITLSKMGISISATPSTTVSIQPSSFKLEKLKGHIPDAVILQIPDTAANFNITSTLRLSHFLAQCGHESAGFKVVFENLNYSADGLNKIFPRYFKNAGRDANQFARNPEKIANIVYANRMSNGDTSSGDGWRFRGRGYIQLTGRANYTKFDKMVTEDILAQPDLVATKYPLMSAAFFFDSNNLWSLCDRGADDATITAVTRRVNGGTIGLADRIKHFKEYYSLLR